jgi:hypothetical protein
MPLIDDSTTALPYDYATGSVRPATAPVAPEPTSGEMWGAAFRQGNILASAATNITMKVENDVRDPKYSAWGEISGTPYEEFWESFASSNNADYTAALKAQIDMERQDRETLAASGWAGVGAGFAAALADPTVLIPGIGVAAKAGQGYKLGRMALAGAATGFVGTAAQEAGLQASQETRTFEESAINVGIGTILGGLLGSGAYALLSPAERAVAAKAYDRLGGFDGQPSATSLSAASVDRFTREDLTVSGRASGFLARVTSGLNPNLRSMQRALPEARQYLMSVFENTLGVRANERGLSIAPGGAAETDARRMVGERLGLFSREARQIYKEMKKAGINMSEADFHQAVGFAANRGDQAMDGNMYVTRAAQALRSKVLEPARQDMVNTGLLPEDAYITTAQSYFPRMWNQEKLVASEFPFKDVVSRYYATEVLPEQFAKDQQMVQARVAKLRQMIDDLQLDAPTRLRTLQDIERAGADLDAGNVDNIELYSQIVEQERVARAAREAGDRAGEQAAKAEAKRLREQGGQSLRDYLAQRTDLRRRRRNVDFGVAGLEQRVEALRQRLTDIEDENMRALATLVKRGQVVERINQKWDAAKIEATLNDLTDRFEAMVRQADRSEQNARQAVEKMRQKIADKNVKLREQEVAFKAKAKDAKKNDPMAKPALDQKAYEAQQQRLELEIKADERELEMLERIATTQANYAEKIGSLHARMEAVAELDPEARIAEARAVTDTMIRERSATTLARGERAQRILERMDQLDPEQVKTRVKAIEEQIAKREADFNERWGAKVDEGFENARFNEYGRQIADDAFNILSGRARVGDTVPLPEFMTPIQRGPMKERTLNIPDELVEEYLVKDAMQVASRYARVSAGSVSVKKALQRFGFKNQDEMRQAVRNGYEGLAQQVENARTVDEALAIVGKEPGMLDNFRAWAGREDVKVTKERLLTWLNDDMTGALDDLNAGIERILGTYKLQENNTGFGRLVQRANMFNYARLSGNFGLSAITDLYNAAFAHGVSPFLREGVKPLLTNLDAIKLQAKEAKLAGLMVERTLNQRLFTAGEIGDPFAEGTVIDRMLRNVGSIATKMNGVALMQDLSEGINAALTQNRIFKGIASGKDDEFLAKLGLGPTERERVSAMFKRYGTVEDDVLYIANSDLWDDAYAAEAFRNALNKAAGMYAVRPGAGDLPLFASTPLGKALLQFRTFALAAHQRTTLRAMQEGPGAIVRGIVGTTAAGMLVSWLAALRSGQEGYERWRRKAENPGWWIAEGFDRGGFVPLMFEAANTTEKISGTVFGETFNPVKTPAGMAFGGAAYGGESSRNIGRNPISSLVGPTIGLPFTVLQATGAGVGLATGEDPSAAQQRAATSLIPLLGTMPVAKEALQMLTGDSPYLQ